MLLPLNLIESSSVSQSIAFVSSFVICHIKSQKRLLFIIYIVLIFRKDKYFTRIFFVNCLPFPTSTYIFLVAISKA